VEWRPAGRFYFSRKKSGPDYAVPVMYQPERQRYASDVTDAEWALIEPHMPRHKMWTEIARRKSADTAPGAS
jgi:hypothetical protein